MSISGLVAQDRKADSVLALIKKDKQDTNKVIHLNFISRYFRNKRIYGKTLSYSDSAVVLSKKIKYTKGLYIAFSNIARTYTQLANYPKAIDYYFKIMDLSVKVGNQKMMGLATTNLGMVYWEEGDYLKALNYDMEALKIEEETKDNQGMAMTNGNIAGVYYKMGNREKALIYYDRALVLDSTLNDLDGVSIDLGNIGTIYKEMGRFSEALSVDRRALTLESKMGDEDNVAAVTGNIGNVYFEQKKYSEAEKYLKEALRIADSIKFIDGEKDNNETLASLYAITGRWQLAYQHQVRLDSIRDSIVNKDKIEQIGKLEAKAEYDKQLTIEQAKEEQTSALANADHKRQEVVTWLVASIAIAIALIAAIVFRSLRIARKQKVLIEQQKTKVEEKQKEILDSITYAKRLQNAILPPLSLVKQFFPESFIVYKPKDIVAGDFYWMQKVARIGGKGDVVLIAAADCTGHGVPGALVSVVCSNAINRIVKEVGIRDTGSVLDNVRDVVLETFSQKDPLGEKSDGNVQDGMDISLCAINLHENILEWSGANNPLWYVHKNKLIEIQPDKQPVGKQDNAKPFTTHLVNIEKGDIIYLFTDGYADQFGGPKGKKFKYKQLQDLLLANSALTMDEQKRELENTLNTWKGSLEQVDDILIMGIRI